MLLEQRRAPVSLVICACLILAVSETVPAHGQNGAGDNLLPGLVGEYSVGPVTQRRIDEDIAFDWSDASPTTAIPQRPIRVLWTGRWQIPASGEYTISAYVSGQVRVELAARSVLDGTDETGGWVHGKPSRLDEGTHPVTIRYTSAMNGGQIGLYWQSDRFGLELVPDTCFAHDVADVDRFGKAGPRITSRGDALIRAYRCNACHNVPIPDRPLKAPSLRRLKSAVRIDWLVRFLCDTTAQNPTSKMPDFGISVDEAHAVSTFLLSGEAVALRQHRSGSARRGQQLFERIGCVACHSVEKRGRDALFGGGDLTAVAKKRPTPFFFTWLLQPNEINPDYRMPVFALSLTEASDLAEYLANLGDGAAERTFQAPDSKPTDPAQHAKTAELGRQIIESKRCASCHEIPGIPVPARLEWKLPKNIGPNRLGCMGSADPIGHRPGYRFSASDVEAVLAASPSPPSSLLSISIQERGRRVIEANECFGCHSRGHHDGLRPIIAPFLDDDLNVQTERLAPALDGIGDKLHTSWLKEAVAGRATRLRPWLAPRMPRFPLDPQEVDAVAESFVRHDRLPHDERPTTKTNRTAEDLVTAAKQLVGSQGFGCVSCHSVGLLEPTGLEPGTRGSNLRSLASRMRETWFLRWIRNPARTTPGTEMPAITLAVPGVLDGTVETQLHALWHGLNAPQFDLPTAGVVRELGTEPGGRAVVVRDVFEHGPGDYTTRPFAVALPNRHNLLFDLDRFTLRRWWVGDFARQKTRGKTWFWEAVKTATALEGSTAALIAIVSKGQTLWPVPDGQSAARLEGYEFTPHGLRVKCRVHFGSGRWVPVEMSILAEQRHTTLGIKLSGVAEDSNALLAVPIRPESVIRSNRIERIASNDGLRVATAPAAGGFARLDDRTAAISMLRDRNGFCATLNLMADATAPPTPAQSARQAAPVSKLLAVVPGYETIRLPVPQEPMPTALAFRADGAMIMSSLKGEVFLVRDADGDGLLDHLSRFSDFLAAPYGVIADGNDVLVSHKHELLRLKDTDNDGRTDRTEVIASGWGVTSDYHDWAVGPVRNLAGDYFVALPCQQDDRPAAAAIGRGKVLRIAADGNVSVFAAGIRFAMGLATNGRGELFATDNQGHANVFNELNHIRAGRHFGFFNKLETVRPDQPTCEPAIKIPHPWSRSVNPIVFVPDGAAFGPFQNQLIAGDYTNRSLIRLSLQRVGETYQGCAYAFSLVEQRLMELDATFLGPVALAFGPDASLYVGSMVDSGWGGGNNRGTIERVRYVGPVPLGIREIRAHRDGFDIDFTGAVDPSRAKDRSQYRLTCYRRTPTGNYYSPDQDRTAVVVDRVCGSESGKSVRLNVHPMRPGFVYDIIVGPIGDGKSALWPNAGYYTLNTVPQN
jgi:glucose/arabinose dehydrogenase/cytochrome c2